MSAELKSKDADGRDKDRALDLAKRRAEQLECELALAKSQHTQQMLDKDRLIGKYIEARQGRGANSSIDWHGPTELLFLTISGQLEAQLAAEQGRSKSFKAQVHQLSAKLIEGRAKFDLKCAEVKDLRRERRQVASQV